MRGFALDQDSSGEAKSCRALALKVVAYLRAHPEARDNLRGISEWWLGCPADIAEAALDYLCTKGFLRRNQHNGQTLYSRDPAFPDQHLPRLLGDIPSELA